MFRSIQGKIDGYTVFSYCIRWCTTVYRVLPLEYRVIQKHCVFCVGGITAIGIVIQCDYRYDCCFASTGTGYEIRHHRPIHHRAMHRQIYSITWNRGDILHVLYI
jgi:hypothetical protein